MLLRCLTVVLLVTIASCAVGDGRRNRNNRRTDRRQDVVVDRSNQTDHVSRREFSEWNVTALNETERSETERSEPAKAPGFRARVTQRGFNFAAQLATDLLMAQMKMLKIPTIEKDIATTTVKVSNIRVVEFPEPSNKITILEGRGLRWQTWNMEPIFNANYGAVMGFGFFSVEKEGIVTVICSRMEFNIDFILHHDPLGERPFVVEPECLADGDITLSFEGGWSEMLNAASTVLGSFIKSTIMEQICLQATSQIEAQVNAELLARPMIQRINDMFELDLSITGFPNIRKSFIEVNHRGAMFYVPDPHEPPFEPPRIPAYGKHRSRMVYWYVTDFVVNSGLYAAFQSGQMAVNVTEDVMDLIPTPARTIMRLMCPEREICLGRVFPQLASLFPEHTYAEVDMRALKAPYLRFQRAGRSRMWTYSEARFFVRHPDQSRTPLFTAHVNITSSVKVEMNGSHVSFDIGDLTPTAEVVESFVGDPHQGFAFHKLLNAGAEQFIMKKMKDHAAEGFKLPSTDDVKLLNCVILPVKTKGLFVVAADIYVNPEMDLQSLIEQAVVNGTLPVM